MAFSVGAIVGEVRLDTGGITSGMKRATGSVKAGTIALGTFMGNMATRAVSSIKNMVTSALGAVRSLITSSVEASNRYESAMMGLEGVSRKLGLVMDDVRAEAESLAQDGLMGVGEAAAGLKNLLAAGFGLEKSVEMMNTFKDAAAFGRASAFGFGEAVVGATEGIKNQNSMLVDNVGITKNISVMLKEAGFTMQDLTDKTEKGTAAREALHAAIKAEGQLFEGDAKKASETFQGATGRLNTSVDKLKRTIGDLLKPALSGLIDIIDPLVISTTDWIEANRPEIMEWMKRAVDDLKEAMPGLIATILSMGERVKLWGLEIAIAKARVTEFIMAIPKGLLDVKRSLGVLGLGLIDFVVDMDEAQRIVDTAFAESAVAVRKLELERMETKAKLKNTTEEMEKKIREALGLTEKKAEETTRVIRTGWHTVKTETKAATENLNNMAAATEAVAKGVRDLAPAMLGPGGNLIIHQHNYPPVVTGTGTIKDIRDTIIESEDANEGGARGEGETPPGF